MARTGESKPYLGPIVPNLLLVFNLLHSRGPPYINDTRLCRLDFSYNLSYQPNPCPELWTHGDLHIWHSMIGENRQLVTNEPAEFEKSLVEVQDYRKIANHFRGIYRIYPQFSKGKPEDVNM